MREFELIDALRTCLAARRDDTRLGIGDDAGILAPLPHSELLVTTDTLIRDRHFPGDTSVFDIGYKAVAVNLSDIAAMGGAPAWLTVSLAAPALDRAWADAFVDGLQAACAAYPGPDPIDIVGGDTTRADQLMVTVTAIGHVPSGQAIRRSGARVGDLIAVTGTLGDAAAGLVRWPQREPGASETDPLIRRLVRPDLRDGRALIGRATAALDVSDGFLADLGHILTASNVGARLAVDDLPAAHALAAAAPDLTTFRRWQATGGDDYELCLTAPADQIGPLRDALDCALTVVGEITAEPGLTCLDRHGQCLTADVFSQAGWDHFA
ncbi:thiamine monophosphate kinase [Salinisphaera japonica YTM-1]|uniref:Thiamine-monophosphate kinase n=1 Tax=Salinisphaera japonica YTM-1 TaxID=1209778 RepID=A0A423PJ28_9GAMM|nr:thiamine monophosphate kinase [Salinisphaera japonica YTM-1]